MKIIYSTVVVFAMTVGSFPAIQAQSQSSEVASSTDEARQAILRLVKSQEEALDFRLVEIERLNEEIAETQDNLSDARFNRNVAKVTLGVGVVTTIAGIYFARKFGGGSEWAVNIPRGLIVAGVGGTVAAGSGVYLLTVNQVRDLKVKLTELEDSLKEEKESLEKKKVELLEIKKTLGVE